MKKTPGPAWYIPRVGSGMKPLNLDIAMNTNNSSWADQHPMGPGSNRLDLQTAPQSPDPLHAQIDAAMAPLDQPDNGLGIAQSQDTLPYESTDAPMTQPEPIRPAPQNVNYTTSPSAGMMPAPEPPPDQGIGVAPTLPGAPDSTAAAASADPEKDFFDSGWGKALMALAAGAEGAAAFSQGRAPTAGQHIGKYYEHKAAQKQQQKQFDKTEVRHDKQLQMQIESHKADQMAKVMDFMQKDADLPLSARSDPAYQAMSKKFLETVAPGIGELLHTAVNDPAQRATLQGMISDAAGGNDKRIKDLSAIIDQTHQKGIPAAIEKYVKDNKSAIEDENLANVTPKLQRLMASLDKDQPELAGKLRSGEMTEADLHEALHSVQGITSGERAFLQEASSEKRNDLLASLHVKTNKSIASHAKKKEDIQTAADVKRAEDPNYDVKHGPTHDYLNTHKLPNTPENVAEAQAAERANKVELTKEQTVARYEAMPKLDPDTVSFMARQLNLGDQKILSNLGRNQAAMMQVRNEAVKQAKSGGQTAEDIVAQQVKMIGVNSESRAVGTRAGNLAVAVEEAVPMLQTLREASAKVNRSGFIPLAKLELMLKNNTNDADVIQFKVAYNAMENIYARVVQPVGPPTDTTKAHFRESFEKATSQKGMDAGLDMLAIELKNAQKSVPAARESIKAEITGKPSAAPAPEAAPVAPKAAPKIMGKEEYYKLYPDRRPK